MASLKEVKERIASVNGTLKITSAMKMVASAKLHKAQELIEGMWPYEQRLSRMLEEFLDAYPEMDSQLTAERPVKRVALVVFASNGSLCGGYNANVVRRFREWVEQNLILGKENLVIYPIGKKIEEAVRKAGFTPAETFGRLADKPDREVIAQLADRLTKSFLDGDVDHVGDLHKGAYTHIGNAERVNRGVAGKRLEIGRQNQKCCQVDGCADSERKQKS